MSYKPYAHERLSDSLDVEDSEWAFDTLDVIPRQVTPREVGDV